MATAEEKRLEMLNPPEKTPELFEKLLPYAIALDCENIWGEKFAAVLAAASYVAPAWYVGQNFAVNRFDSFSNDLNTSQYDHTARTSSSSSSPGSFSDRPGADHRAAEAAAGAAAGGERLRHAPQHFLYFLPLPQGQGSLRPTLGVARTNGSCCSAIASARKLDRSTTMPGSQSM